MKDPIQDATEFFKNYKIHYKANKNYCDILIHELGINKEERDNLEKQLYHANQYMKNITYYHFKQVEIAMYSHAHDVTEEQENLLRAFNSAQIKRPQMN